MPRSREALEKLPGRRPQDRERGAQRSAFGEPTIAVDTHIFRVANRTNLAPGKDPLAVEQKLEQFVPDEFRLHAHHWLILHGRYICVARMPKCPDCVIRDLCEYRHKTRPVDPAAAKRAAAKVPARRPAKGKRPDVHAVTRRGAPLPGRRVGEVSRGRALERPRAEGAALIALHPEYHRVLDDPTRHVERDYAPEGGEVNPFLHLSLHLAVAEQLAIDQPPGMRAQFERLRERAATSTPRCTPCSNAWARRCGRRSAWRRRPTRRCTWIACDVRRDARGH